MATFSDEINRMIIDLVTDTEFTSASPGFINRVLTVGQTTNPDLEEMIISLTEEIINFRLEEAGIPVGDTPLPEREDTTVPDEEPKEPKLEQSEIKDFVNDTFGGEADIATIQKFGKNPRAFAIGLLRTIPFLGGIVAISDFTQAMLQEMQRVDSFFKVFIPDIENLHNQLRDREEIANIQAGNQQLILSVRAGATSPRTAYNTFNQFNKNRVKLENEFTIRDNSGVS